MSGFLRRNLMISIIKVFRAIVFIFILISIAFRPMCPPAFFRCLSNSGTCTKLRTTSFIESTRVACSDSVNHNRVQVLRTPVLLRACSQDWTCNLQMIVSLEVEMIDREEHWKIRRLKESAHMLGYSDPLSRPSIEMNTIWEPIIKKLR